MLIYLTQNSFIKQLKYEQNRYTISYVFQHFLSASSSDSLMIAVKMMALNKCQNM